MQQLEDFIAQLEMAFTSIENAYYSLYNGLLDEGLFNEAEMAQIVLFIRDKHILPALLDDPDLRRLPKLTLDCLPTWAIQRINEWTATHTTDEDDESSHHPKR